MKINSVMLQEDYRSLLTYVPKNTKGKRSISTVPDYEGTVLWIFKTKNMKVGLCVTEDEILSNETGLFYFK